MNENKSENKILKKEAASTKKNSEKRVDVKNKSSQNNRHNSEKHKESNKEKSSGGQREFENFEDADKIYSDILQVKSNLFIRLAVLIFTGAFSFIITFANDFGLPVLNIFNRQISPAAYVFINTIMGIISIGASYTVLFMGIKNLIKRKADCDSIAAINITIAVIAGIVTLFHPDAIREGNFHIYICAAILCLLCNTIGKIMIIRRTEENFRYVAGKFTRYAVTNIDNEDVANRFTKGSLNDFPELSTMRKTEFIEDFMKNSYSPDAADSFASKAAPVILAGGLIMALISFIFDKTSSGTDKIITAFAACSGLLSMCCSFSLMIYINATLSKATNKFLKYSAVILGYSAVYEFSDTNSVLIDAGQLFPEENVDIVNLKVLSAISMDECLLMAASLSCASESILNTSFKRILRGKTDMLYSVENYAFEENFGLSGWIENKRVLLGGRNLMEKHSIEGIPTAEQEKKYAKGGNTVVYLSISGAAAMMFIVKAVPSLAVSSWLQEFENEDVVTVIKTSDGFLSKEFISSMFGVSEDSIKLLPSACYDEYKKQTAYKKSISTSMICSGHFSSFAMLIIGTKRIKNIANLGTAVQFGMAVLGGVLSFIMMIAGTFTQISPCVAVFYNLVFLLISLLLPRFQKI